MKAWQHFADFDKLNHGKKGCYTNFKCVNHHSALTTIKTSYYHQFTVVIRVKNYPEAEIKF